MHPKILEKFKHEAPELLENRLESASDANETRFLAEAKGPIKREIVKIIRLKKGGQEYFYWHEEQKSRDYLGNETHFYKVDGMYKDPEFRRERGSNGQPKAVEIAGQTDVYEYKWPQDWKPELEDLVSESVDLLVSTLGRKYGGFSFQDFKDRTFDELVTLGKYGTLSPQGIEREKKRQRNAQ